MKKIVLYVGAFLFSIAGYAQQALWGGGDIVSPQINKDNSVTFRILAPKASKVEIEGDFLPAQKIKTPFGEVEAPGRVQLKEGKNGVWEYTSSILPSEMYNYSVYVNDFKTTDPSNVYQNRDIATITNYFLIGRRCACRLSPDNRSPAAAIAAESAVGSGALSAKSESCSAWIRACSALYAMSCS